MIDNRTPRLGLLLPDADNYLEDDVVRLSESMTILDGKVATVGADGKIPVEQIPAVAITDTFAVNTEAAMLALNAQPGDVAIRSDISKTFILMAAPATTLSNWKELVNDALVQLAQPDGYQKVGGLDKQYGNIANTREQWRRQLADAGLNLVAGSFEDGATVNAATDAVWHIAGGQCYVWGGALPKTVPAGSTPESAGGIGAGAWSSVAGQSTLAVLANPNGADKVGLPQGGTVKDTIFWHTPEAEGAKGDGVTDDLAALVAADQKALASGLPVYLGPKTYAISNVFEFQSNHFFGVEGKTRILALKGWNDAIVKSKGAPAGDYLTVDSPSSMVNGVVLENIIIEGGWGGPDDTTRTHTEALRIYGAGTRLNGIRCGYVSGVGFNLGGRGNTTIKYGAPSRYTDLRADFTGEHGIVIGGSSDNHSNWLMVRNAGLKQHNTYDGIRFGGGGGTRGTQFHVWQSGDSQITPYYTNRVRYGLYLASYDSEIVSGHIEGCASAQIIFVGARNSVSSFRVYSNWQPGAAVIMLGDANTFRGEVGAPMNNTPVTAVHAFQLGDSERTVKNYRIDAYIYGCKFINYVNSTGRGHIRASGDLNLSGASGIGTIITGTIPDTDYVELSGPQYSGIRCNTNIVVGEQHSITGHDLVAQNNLSAAGAITFASLPTTAPAESGRLYKDASGFVRVKL